MDNDQLDNDGDEPISGGCMVVFIVAVILFWVYVIFG